MFAANAPLACHNIIALCCRSAFEFVIKSLSNLCCEVRAASNVGFDGRCVNGVRTTGRVKSLHAHASITWSKLQGCIFTAIRFRRIS